MNNYQAGVCCYQPKVEVDNDQLRLVNASYRAKTEFNNCFVIYLKELRKPFVLFRIPAPSKVDVVAISMTS